MTPLWIFAYGSLVFRPDFDFSARIVGKVPGYARRFWQRSSDHRGTPEAPGRVVTLVEAPGEECWGVAYQIAAQHRDEVTARLEHREKGGYRLIQLPFHPTQNSPEPKEVNAYVALADNSEFCGPEEDMITAAVIQTATGPSGHNVEYVIRLAEALDSLGIYDPHVLRMANLVIDPMNVLEEG